MKIHPIIQSFINHPMPKMVFDEIPMLDLVKMKENFKRVNSDLHNMTPAQKEKARNAAHQYLFGKPPTA